MKLTLIRHAIAENRHSFSQATHADHLRPLTQRGRKKMKKGVLGLQTIIPHLDIVASSGFRRADETAEIIQKAFKIKRKTEITSTLQPERDPNHFLTWLQHQQPFKNMAIVGHEPHLSRLIALLSGSLQSRISLQKGGVCLIEFNGLMTPGSGEVSCLFQPSHLRKIGVAVRRSPRGDE